jgi:23S rRNA (adenine2030-N6)-methyltransferase
LELVRGFNHGAQIRVYPGSPFILQHLLRERDKLKLFELHRPICVRWQAMWRN